MAIILQASLVQRPPIPQLNPFSPSLKPRLSKLSPQLPFSRRTSERIGDLAPIKSRFLRHRLVLSCTLNSENVSSASEPISSNLVSENPEVVELSNGPVTNEASGGVEAESEVGSEVSNEDVKKKLHIIVFLMGVFARLRSVLEKVVYSDWFSWWPFWKQEKRLERLIAEADENPMDAAKQSALLVELNKHSPESVIHRFEQRAHAVDSKGVAEYLRALVATNAISEYLPDEQSGKPSSLPSLLQELKQRASGNMEEAFVNPGVSDKQPLHVVMVDPKMSNRSSRFSQEIISTIMFTVAVGLMWYDCSGSEIKHTFIYG